MNRRQLLKAAGAAVMAPVAVVLAKVLPAAESKFRITDCVPRGRFAVPDLELHVPKLLSEKKMRELRASWEHYFAGHHFDAPEIRAMEAERGFDTTSNVV